ncbi:Hypothetical predicted protein [Xyrichtys novacula]|uniref:Uncharacterized protein n=1 Tax=Xyrichtys novacula TaxID=13765 RepID=A0AAV1EZP3_XYRNO|nr:Hypothetical predicted protein [Xyrichtys novacula]
MAVVPPTPPTVGLFGFVAARPRQRESRGGGAPFMSMCMSTAVPATKKPAPRPISEQGPEKLRVGKTHCIIAYVTSL